MLFRIDQSILDVIEAQSSLIALEELARAYQKGYHLLNADIEVLRYLKNVDDLSRGARGVYNHLFNNHSELKAPFNYVTRYIEVIAGDNEIELIDADGTEVVRVPIRYFNGGIAGESILLTENLIDIRMYEIVAKVFLYRHKVRGFKLKYEPIGGGGHTIAEQYRKIQNAKDRLCLSVVDSDKKYPLGTKGGTAAAIEAVIDKSQFLSEVIILNVREIENIIPLVYFQQISQTCRDRQIALPILEKISLQDVRLFIDLKQGVYLFDIVNSENDEFFSYWRNALRNIGINHKCLNGQVCINKKDDKCDHCKIFNGFGNSLAEVLNIMEETTSQKLSESVQPNLDNEWDRIGRKLTTWFCANGPLYVF